MFLEYGTSIALIYVLLHIAYEDYKYHKIFNHRIWQIFFIGLVFYLLFSIKVVYQQQFNQLILLLFVLKSFLISFILSYLLWLYKMWSAGDAKLFTILSFSFPLFFYTNGTLNVFPAFVLLVNTLFIPFLIVGLRFISFPVYYLMFIWQYPTLVKKKLNKKLKIIFSLKKSEIKKIYNYFLKFLLLFVFYRILRFHFQQFNYDLNLDNYFTIIIYFIFFTSYYYLTKFLKKNKYYYFFLAFFLEFYFLFLFLYTNIFFKELHYIFIYSVLMYLGLFLLFKLYAFYTLFLEKKYIKITDLKPGMFLDVDFLSSIKYPKIQIFLKNLTQPLTKTSIQELQDLFKEYQKNQSKFYKKYSVSHFIRTDKRFLSLTEIKAGLEINRKNLLKIPSTKIQNFLKNNEDILTLKSAASLKFLLEDFFQKKEQKKEIIDYLYINKVTHLGLWFLIGTIMTIIFKTSILQFFLINFNDF